MKFPVFQAPQIVYPVAHAVTDENFYNEYNNNVDIDYLQVNAKDPRLLSKLSINHFDIGNYTPRKFSQENFTQVSCNPFYIYVDSQFKDILAQRIVNHL